MNKSSYRPVTVATNQATPIFDGLDVCLEKETATARVSGAWARIMSLTYIDIKVTREWLPASGPHCQVKLLYFHVDIANPNHFAHQISGHDAPACWTPSADRRHDCQGSEGTGIDDITVVLAVTPNPNWESAMHGRRCAAVQRAWNVRKRTNRPCHSRTPPSITHHCFKADLHQTPPAVQKRSSS